MGKKPQLRGQKLLDAIELCLKTLASEKENYVYNASELARRVGCSRPSLGSKAKFIDDVLNRIGAEKRLKRDHPLLEHLHTRIEYLENKNSALEKELRILRMHHAEIYTAMYMESVDAAALIRPVVHDESLRAGECILCGHTLPEGFAFPAKSSVIQLSDHRKD